MKQYFTSLALAICICFPTVDAISASDRGTSDEAVAMVKKVVAYMKIHGAEKTYAAVSEAKGQFTDRDLYVFIIDASGKELAHGSNPRLIGKNVMEMKDTDGKFIVKELFEITNKNGKGWSDHRWPNPITKEIDKKTSYVEKMSDGSIIGCGIYK
jgi:cytochrome c